VSKRPLIHPQIPTPFASSLSPKTLYITATTPFVPALKRIRKLLSEISRREKQSLAATSKRQKPIATNGRLDNGHVERDIADEVARGEKEGEKVYLKATGRAIPRALELGVQFQAEGEGYLVRVEMGSVKAVDDIEVKDTGEANAVDEQAEIPETRMRTVSSVTVSIGLK
jgi:ribonuclease P/MRP protein subunit POP7